MSSLFFVLFSLLDLTTRDRLELPVRFASCDNHVDCFDLYTALVVQHGIQNHFSSGKILFTSTYCLLGEKNHKTKFSTLRKQDGI